MASFQHPSVAMFRTPKRKPPDPINPTPPAVPPVPKPLPKPLNRLDRKPGGSNYNKKPTALYFNCRKKQLKGRQRLWNCGIQLWKAAFGNNNNIELEHCKNCKERFVSQGVLDRHLQEQHGIGDTRENIGTSPNAILILLEWVAEKFICGMSMERELLECG